MLLRVQPAVHSPCADSLILGCITGCSRLPDPKPNPELRNSKQAGAGTDLRASSLGCSASSAISRPMSGFSLRTCSAVHASERNTLQAPESQQSLAGGSQSQTLASASTPRAANPVAAAALAVPVAKKTQAARPSTSAVALCMPRRSERPTPTASVSAPSCAAASSTAPRRV